MADRRKIEVDLGAVRRNVRRVKKATGAMCLAVVKSNGYGMGAERIAGALEGVADWFGTATVAEAVALRKAGIRTPVLVLGQALPEDISAAVSHRISLTAGSMEFIAAASSRKSGRPLFLHLKVDTGMGRIGVSPSDVARAVSLIASSSRLRLEGIGSHLATGEAKDTAVARRQIALMEKVLAQLPERPALTHIANSAGVLCHPRACTAFSMVRVGLLLYGVMPDAETKDTLGLEYALRGTAALTLAKDVPAGTSLSYGLTWVCPEKSRIGVLGLGYGDGFNRGLSGNFSVKRDGVLHPVRGRICMDQTLIELRRGEKPGDEFTFLDAQLSAETMARTCATVPQEILCNFGGPRLKKVYCG